MKRKWVIWSGVLVLLAFLPFSLNRVIESRRRQAYEFELDRARKAGVPTTESEFVAMYHPAPDSQNALVTYAELEKVGMLTFATKLPNILASNLSDSDVIRVGEPYLSKYHPLLDIVDRGSKVEYYSSLTETAHRYRSRFWAGLLVGPARAVMCRGDIECARRHPEQALDNFHEAMRIVKQLRDGLGPFDGSVATQIEITAIEHLCQWAWRDREQSAYLSELKNAVSSLSIPIDPRIERTHLLIDAFSAFNEPYTGLTVPIKRTKKFDWLAFFHHDTLETARFKVVRAFNLYWEGLVQPEAQAEKIDTAGREYTETTQSYINASLSRVMGGREIITRIYLPLFTESKVIIGERKKRESHRLLFAAVLRAMESQTTPESIDTSDLLGPFSNKPLSYNYKNGLATISTEKEKKGQKEILLLFGK